MEFRRVPFRSAIYSIDDKPIKGGVAKFLIAGQRTQFAAFNLQNLLRGRNMAVLGGQFSIFSTNALRDAMSQNHQSSPWVRDSEVEDSLLSLQIKSAGYLTKISPYARARSEEHTSELQSLMRISYAVFCLNKNTYTIITPIIKRH